MTGWGCFREIWVLDFEFHAPPGEQPEPLCLVANEMRTGRRVDLWQDQLHQGHPPFLIQPDVLFVAYFASAEIGCFLQLGWLVPSNVLDLYAEFRNRTNGQATPSGNGLLGALDYFGLPGIAAAAKDEMRDLAIRGGPYPLNERRELLDYCAADVDATARLFERMRPGLDLGLALLRGQYTAAVASMERTGIPVDTGLLSELLEHWPQIQARLVEEVDQAFGVFDGLVFKQGRFEAFLVANGIPWPRLDSGALALDDETFEAMELSYPIIKPLHELRSALAQMRRINLCVGSDHRARCLLSPFQSRTGRNQPSNSRFLFGMSAWLRGLTRPEPGMGLAHIDWSQQEFGIAAHLSGDTAMCHAYESGDPYLEFAKQAGAAPPNATKESHGPIRERFKACVLAVQYGMGEQGLARRLGVTVVEARDLLAHHRRTFSRFWRWSEGVVAYGQLGRKLWTTFGWELNVEGAVNPRALANFPMQANGAEMLRLACIYLARAGILVCAPVHDAVLIEAPLGELEATAEKAQALMAQASSVVLGGPALRSDAELIRHPDRFSDKRGAGMWQLVNELLASIVEWSDP